MASGNTSAESRRFNKRWATNAEDEAILPVQAFWEKARVLKAYYDTDDLYARIRYGLEANGAKAEKTDSVRSPTFRAVEFHVGHVMPGTLPGALTVKGGSESALNEKGKKQLDNIFRFSNFSSRKQAYVRTAAWSGQGFIKIAQKGKFPFLQVLKPQFTREFDVDERGHLTYYRSSIPEKVGRGANAKVVWVTEVYSKEEQAIFRYRKDHPVDEEKNEEPEKITRFRALGIDFVPIVWAPFIETEPGRGLGLFENFLDKVDNLNRAATRLHDILFRYNRSVWALERSNLTAEGYEMPPVEVEGRFDHGLGDGEAEEDSFATDPRTPRNDDGTRTLGSDPVTNLPSGVVLRSLVPTIDYASALQVVNSDMDDLAQDMPELLYTKALESAARDSSKVLEIQLAGAIDRAREARGNLENGIIRAYQMAVTIGQRANLSEYSGIGNFEAGDLAFEFEARPVVPPDPAEEAEETIKKAEALVEKINVLKAMGLDREVLLEEVAAVVGVERNRLKPAEGSLEPGAEGGENLGEEESALRQLLGGAVAAGSATAGAGGSTNDSRDRGSNGDTQS